MIGYSLFSGSSGNAVFLREKNTRILIDAGATAKKIAEALAQIGEREDDLSAILVTHEHSDHTKALGTVCQSVRVPVYCLEKVARELYLNALGAHREKEAAALLRQIRVIEPGAEYEIGDIVFSPFDTPHDSADSCGYRFGEDLLGIATDLGHVSESIEKGLFGCRNVVLESNYDETMLWEGSYPIYLKQRVAGENGHLSNADCAAFLPRLLERGSERFTLFHLSKENNTPQKALAESEKALAAFGQNGKAYSLQCAERFEVTKIL